MDDVGWDPVCGWTLARALSPPGPGGSGRAPGHQRRAGHGCSPTTPSSTRTRAKDRAALQEAASAGRIPGGTAGLVRIRVSTGRRPCPRQVPNDRETVEKPRRRQQIVVAESGQRNPVVLHRHRDPADGQCVGRDGRRDRGCHVPVHRCPAVRDLHGRAEGLEVALDRLRGGVRAPGRPVRRFQPWRDDRGTGGPAGVPVRSWAIFWVIGRSPPRLKNELWWLRADRRDHHVRAGVLGRRAVLLRAVYILLVFAGIWALCRA